MIVPGWNVRVGCSLGLAAALGLGLAVGPGAMPGLSAVAFGQAGAAAGGGSGAVGAPAGQGMEFADDPKFAVAGVTDWTAVGGHGSDAVLKTSEDLARETARLGGAAGEVDAAEEARLRAALEREPGSAAANRAMGMYDVRVGRFGAAVPLLQKAIAVEPGRAEDEFELARACAGVGDTTQAEVHVRRAMAEGDRAEFHRELGEIEEQRGDPVGAVAEMKRATAMEGSEANYLAWGSELLVHRAVWEAGEVFRHGVEAHPDSVRLRAGLGAALFAAAQYTEAAAEVCRASDLAPGDAGLYEQLGKMMLAAQDPLPCVREHLERWVAREPGSAAARYYAGMAMVRGGEVPAGRALLEEAVRLDAREARAWLELGVLAMGEMARAQSGWRYISEGATT